MKRTVLLILAVVLCFVSSACQSAGKTENVQIDLGSSQKFSEAERKAAADCVLHEFLDFKGCSLLRLWYDEEESDFQVDGYMSSGRGSTNGVKRENVIVLFSDFYVNEWGASQALNRNFTYTDWNWILIRYSETEAWRLDDAGY